MDAVRRDSSKDNCVGLDHCVELDHSVEFNHCAGLDNAREDEVCKKIPEEDNVPGFNSE